VTIAVHALASSGLADAGGASARSVDSLLREILHRPDAAISVDDLELLARLERDPSATLLRDLPAGLPTLQQVVDSRAGLMSVSNRATIGHLRRRVEVQELERTPGITRELLDREVRELAALPDAELGHAQLRRLAVLDQLDAGLRPELLPATGQTSLQAIADAGYLPNQYEHVREAIDRVRRHIERIDLEADPSVDTASLTAEVRSIVGTRDVELTPTDLRRLHVLAGTSPRIRPALPEPVGDRASWLDAIRRSVGLRAVRDATAGTSALDRELRAIVTRPVADITEADTIRLAEIERMPADRRPWLPDPRGDGRTFQALAGHRPYDYTDSADAFDELRRHYADLDRRADPMADPFDVGEFTPERLDDGSLLDTGIARMRSASEAGRSPDRDDLMRARQVAGLMSPGSEVERQLQERLLALLDANIARVTGQVRDGYPRYADLAEIGGAVAEAETLLAIRGIATDANPRGAAVADAGAAAELLTF
jgi:hypothetical protein